MAYLDSTGLQKQIQYIKAYVENKISAIASNGTVNRATADGLGNNIAETYATKAELSAIPQFDIQVVNALPTANISDTTVYLVLSNSGAAGNLYTEYIHVNDTWEKSGEQTTDIDLSDYMPLSGGTLTGNIYTTPYYDATIKSPEGGQTLIVSKGVSTKGTPPAEDEWHTLVMAVDNTGSTNNAHKYGQVETAVRTTGATSIQLKAYKNEANSTAGTYIEVGYDANGNVYTAAPTPATADNSTKIATTAYVNTKLDGYSTTSHTHNYAGSASAGGPANAVARETSTTPTNSNRTIWFSQANDATKLAYDDSFTYNPSTDSLTVTKINGVTVGSSPKFTDTVYTHPTSAGNIHLPSGGASGNFLKWSSAGTGKWESLTKAEVTTALGYTPPTTNTTYSNMTAATASAAGKTGLVPAPAAGAQDKFLRGNATWATASDIINTLSTGTSSATADDYVVCQYAGGGTTTTTYHRRPVSKLLDALTKAQVTTALGYTPPTTNTTYSNMTAATADAAGKAGLVPAPGKGKQTSFLRGDGTWVVPTNTTNSAGAGNSTSKLFLVGTTAQSTGTSYSNANVYATNGALHATSISTGGNVVVGGTANTNYLQLPSGIKLY